MNRIECPRINPLRLFLLAIVFPCCLLFAACSDPEQTKAEHLKRGEALLKEKKFVESELEFRNALQIDPQLGAAYWGLAQANEGLERIPETIESLKQTIAKDPNNLEASTKLGNWYLAFSRAPNAEKEQLIAEAERLTSEVLSRDPNNIEGHILNGNLLYVRGKRDEALRELTRAIEINPQRVESQLSLGIFYTTIGDTTRAEEIFKRAVAMNAGSALPHLTYGRFLIAQNRAPEAEAEFRRAVEADPQDRTSHEILASYYLVNKQLDKAEAAFRKIAEIQPDRPEGQAKLADFYSTIERNDDAVRIYESLVTKFPDFTRARYRLGEIAIQRGDTAAAAKQTEEILAKNARDTQALILRARLNLQKDKARDAVKDLQEVLNSEPNSLGGLYYMADANLRLGQTEQAREFAAALSRYYPTYLPARLLQVQINLDGGDAPAALRLADELVATLKTATPDAQTTPQLLAELRSKALTARGAARLQTNNLAAARADMQAALEVAPNSPASYLNLARVAIRERRLDEAANLYERALAIDKTNFDALSGLAQIALAANRADDAHNRIDAAIAVDNRNPALHYLKGQIFGAQGNGSATEAAFRQAIAADENYMPAYFALANFYRLTQQVDRGVAEYQKVIERRPDDIAALTLLGILEDSRNNHAAAAVSYRRALETDSTSASSTFAANNLAWLAAEHGEGNLDEALQQAQRIVQRFPNEAGYVDTLGWVLHKKGLQPAAIEQLRKAVQLAAKKGSDSALYRYHLAAALAASGDRASARRELEQAVRLGQNPNQNFTKLDDARRMLATM